MAASNSTPTGESSKEPSKMKRRRSPLYPKPILDSKLLQEALLEKNITLKPSHFETFYQLLHRAEYPPLSEFVDHYYNQEANKSSDAFGDRKITPKDVGVQKGRKRNIRQLPKAFLDYLSSPDCEFVTLTTTLQSRPTSSDQSTTKLAIELQDGHVIESVLMRHFSKDGARATVCVSSQVGCAMACTFCATGTMGIRGNLCEGEILEQLVHTGQILKEEVRSGMQVVPEFPSQDKGNKKQLEHVRNVVFMGMGEPLNNYRHVLAACRAMLDRRRWNLAHGRVTVSTVGVTPQMRRLTKDLPEVNLALSLHAPTQAKRVEIVPTAKQYPIEDMIQALDEHMMVGREGQDRKMVSKRRRAMIEYVMINGDTSTFESAHQLGQLCQDRHLVVNLIPYNRTDVKDKLHCPTDAHMAEFQRIVTSYGSFCSIRRTMGADIAGACGQLVVAKERNEQNNPDIFDIEDEPLHVGNDHLEKKRERMKGRVSIRSSNKKAATKPDKKEIIDYEKWMRPLTIATVVAASCFVMSAAVIVVGRRR